VRHGESQSGVVVFQGLPLCACTDVGP
jgi:hypothetical protein